MAHGIGKIYDIDYVGGQRTVQVLLHSSTDLPALKTDDTRMRSLLAAAWASQRRVEFDYDPSNQLITKARIRGDGPGAASQLPAADEWVVTAAEYDVQSSLFSAWFSDSQGLASRGEDKIGAAQTIIETAVAWASTVQSLSLTVNQIERVKLNRESRARPRTGIANGSNS